MKQHTFANQLVKMIKYLFFSTILICTTQIFAQNWTGAIDANWNNPANWSATPSNGGNFVINPSLYTGNAVSPVISAASNFSPGTILVTNGGQLTIQNNVTTSDNVEIIGVGSSLIVSSGTLQVAGGGDGRLIVDLGANMLVSGGTVNVGQRLISGSGSLITIQNGTVFTEERLLMDLGGAFVQNGGVVNVGETFAMADGEGTTSCSYTLNGGTLNITGEMGFENEAGNFEPTFLQTGGTLNVTGDVSWFGVAPGLGTPKMILQGGTANVNGNLLNMPASSVNMYLKVKGTAQLNFQNATVTLLQSSDSILLADQGKIQFAGNLSTINNAGVIQATGGTIQNLSTNLQANGTGIYQLHHLTLNPNSTWNQNQTALKLRGDLSKSGAIVFNQQPLIWNGTGSQFLTGVGELALNNMVVENSSSEFIDFIIPIRILNQLTLNQGFLHSSNPNVRLNFVDNASVINASSLSFVESEIRKIGNDSFQFPIGKNGIYAPIEMTAPSSINQEVTAMYSASPFSNTSSLHASLSAVSPLGYWKLIRQNSEQLGMKLHWSNATQQGISNCADLSFASWNGSLWQAQVAFTSGSCSGTNSGSIEANPPLLDSIFTFGFIGNVTSQNITLCAGESLTVGTNVYTQSGNYMNILTDMNGEDSTVLTYLTVLPVLASSQEISLCFGESIIIQGQEITTSGSYSHIYTSISGCDSTVTSLITIHPELNSSVLINNGILQAQETNATFQWYATCDAPMILANETQANYTPISNGNYFVTISSNGCSVNSECIVVNFVGLDEIKVISLKVSPNPSSTFFQIQGLESNDYSWTVTNALGQRIITGENNPQIDLTNHHNGIYILQVASNQQIHVISLIKE